MYCKTDKLLIVLLHWWRETQQEIEILNAKNIAIFPQEEMQLEFNATDKKESSSQTSITYENLFVTQE